eukprot:GHVR01113715.1.p4 GENE.GHVR01113715.1~~GHVR01113715.1.p4  ORF type:complete len:104 (-),score=25.67 GHVR01113715.1:52-363(-)
MPFAFALPLLLLLLVALPLLVACCWRLLRFSLVCSSARLLARLLAWSLAERDMELLDARYDFYDKSKTGTLEEDELKTLLTDLNEGIPPSKAEVREDKKNSPR